MLLRAWRKHWGKKLDSRLKETLCLIRSNMLSTHFHPAYANGLLSLSVWALLIDLRAWPCSERTPSPSSDPTRRSQSVNRLVRRSRLRTFSRTSLQQSGRLGERGGTWAVQTWFSQATNSAIGSQRSSLSADQDWARRWRGRRSEGFATETKDALSVGTTSFNKECSVGMRKKEKAFFV